MTEERQVPNPLSPNRPRDLVLALRELVAERIPADIELPGPPRRGAGVKRRYDEARQLSEQFEAENGRPNRSSTRRSRDRGRF